MSMHRRFGSVAILATTIIATTLGGCDSDPVAGSDTGAGDVCTTCDIEDGTDAVDDTTSPGPQWDNACDDGQACEGGRSCRSGVCVADPPASNEGFLTDPISNTPTTERPQFSCADQSLPAPATSATTTMYGAVARFGDGRQTNKMQVDVFLAADFDPSACEAESDEDDRQTCYRNYGIPIGSSLSVAVPALDPKPICDGHEGCPLGYQCFDPDDLGEGACEAQFGRFEIAGVPLDTELVIRTHATVSESRWHDTYNFGVVLFTEHEVAGKVQYDATMVSEGQWQLTPNSVQMPEIDEDNGALGGRIRDCRQEGRDSWPISEVTLDLANRPRGIVYFNNLADDTVPLIARESTNILGRFAALDIPAGWNRIAGAVRIDGQVMSAGARRFYVVPGALSMVTWPGQRPFWRQN